MHRELVEVLRCPRCREDRALGLQITREDDREIREGTLQCRACGHEAAIEHGVVDLMHDPPDFVVREAAGLERFAEFMRNTGWDRERVLKLPLEDHGYWFVQNASIEQLLATEDFRAGQWILDVGSNTCWASALFARLGLNVVALDIATTELQGLRTAEWWFERDGTYFERVLGVMFDLPLADNSLDYVFCCEVLHHNDPANLRRTFRELHRVLKPGGKLMMINEPLRFLTDLKRDHAQEVAEFEGHEHVYFVHQYYLAARRAGFRVTVEDPIYHSVFRGDPLLVSARMSRWQAVRLRAVDRARRHGFTRRAYRAYLNLVRGGVALNMTCTKPAR